MAEHETRDDIDLISGEFWGRNPHDAFTWMRANAPVYWDGRTWGSPGTPTSGPSPRTR